MEPPTPSRPADDWAHRPLYERVKEALFAVPAYFESRTVIEGLLVTDLQTLNTPLGATIEDRVVATLNRLRPLWDPDDEYQAYRFERQAQTFPDVLLKRERDGGSDPLLGIELKGWYVLAKEREPNFRFKVTPDACAPADLLVIVPWALSNVLSGTPITLKPWVASARYAAEYRNYWWSEERATTSDRGIEQPVGVAPYPVAKGKITDEPKKDSGSNFGRIARTGIMDDYLEERRGELLAGIPIGEWLAFLKKFKQ